MMPLRIVLILFLNMAVAVTQADDDPQKITPLFSSNDVLAVTISAPFSTIMEDRLSDEEFPATLTYTDDAGSEVAIDLKVRARGRFRREPRVCSFAPLRLNFKTSSVADTEFAHSDKLKLVTHCRTGNRRYAQALLSEYMAYRIFNVVTDRSFRVRPLQVRYVDNGRKRKETEAFAFIIEHREQVSRRIGLSENDAMETEIALLDSAHTNLGSIFQFLIGNTDFSPIRAAPGETCCHNYMLFGDAPGDLVVIPYDFDQSGLVSAPHGSPNPRFKLRSVRERLYRGRCANNQHVDESAQKFIAHKAEIYALFEEHPGFTRGTRKQTRRFLDDFYEILGNPTELKASITDRCL